MTDKGTIRGEESARAEYRRLAAHYDRRWRRYVAASVRETLHRMAPQPGDRILDVGCGTGALLGALASSGKALHLSGVDLTEEMLAVARGRLGPAVTLRHGPADALPFPDGAFDMVVSTSVFHYLRRPDAALAEFLRVLRPGGRVVITDWSDDFLACRVCDLILRVVNRAHFRIYDSRALASFLVAAGCEGVRVETFRINWPWGMMTAQGGKPAGGARAS